MDVKAAWKFTNLRTDLPLDGDSASQFIPWLMAIMVYLGILSMSGVAVFDAILSGWSRAVTGTVTVQIPSLGPTAELEDEEARTSRAVRTLEALPNVDTLRVLTNSEIDALIAPWLGEDVTSAELPLPALIDIVMTDDSTNAVDELREAVTAVVPDAIVDDHRKWFEHLIDLTEGFRVLAIGASLVVTAALGLTIVFATRASLAEFREVISVLHFIGARDNYIASQFAKRTLNSALRGSVAGLLAGGISILSIGWLARNVESGFLPDVELGIYFWLAIPMVALVAALLAMTTAFVTVLRTLRTMI